MGLACLWETTKGTVGGAVVDLGWPKPAARTATAALGMLSPTLTLAFSPHSIKTSIHRAAHTVMRARFSPRMHATFVLKTGAHWAVR